MGSASDCVDVCQIPLSSEPGIVVLRPAEHRGTLYAQAGFTRLVFSTALIYEYCEQGIVTFPRSAARHDCQGSSNRKRLHPEVIVR